MPNTPWAVPAVCSIGGTVLHREAGVLESNLAEAQLNRVMMRHTRRTALLVDHRKLDRNALVQIVDLADIDVVVTGVAPDAGWRAHLTSLDVRLIH